MANGVPEHAVWAAADAVLARGERPTVERVRAELGRGSPARVGQLLEQWWEQLAQRMKGHALLPELPGEVAQAFAEAWRLALGHAGMTAEAALTEQQNTLFAARTELTQERKLWEIALAAAQGDLAEVVSRLAQAELQLTERQGLLDQMATELTDVRQQRDHLTGQLERRQAELEALRAEHAGAQAYIRTVEDRTHQQMDQARQELKALQRQLTNTQRDHAKAMARQATREQELRSALRAAEKVVAHQEGRVDALEGTLAQWHQASTTEPKRASRSGKATPSQRASKKVSPPKGRTR